jgi:phosphoadenosine phosphosulfate reductase
MSSDEATSSPRFDEGERHELNRHLESLSTPERLEWAWETFEGEIVATSSFQTQSVPLLHLVGRTVPELPVVFLDTGFHFPETLSFRDRLEEMFGLNVRSETNRLGHEEFMQRYGRLYRDDPDLCCHLNKVEPLQRVLDEVDTWLSGVRRDQTEQRRETPIVGRQDGVYKICPMVEWTSEDVESYIDRHDLPRHPLTSEGYTSIGCAPCTECPKSGADDERAGRWAGRDKNECGLHTDRDDEPDTLDSIELDDDDDT